MAKNKALDVRDIGRQALVTKLMRRSLESSKLSMAKNKALDVRGAGEALEIYHGRPWPITFSHDTQFTFGSLTFITSEDGDLKMLLLEVALENLVLVHEPDLCSPANSSTSDSACLGSDPCVGLFIRTVEIVQGIPVMTSILQPSTGASSLSSSVTSPDHDSADDYPEIGDNICWNCSKEGRLNCMVAPNEDPSCNISSRYPTIGRSEASDARTPNAGLV
jgi:hypothetical protein